MVAADSVDELARELTDLYLDRGRLADLAVAGLQYAARASWSSLLDELWGEDGRTAATSREAASPALVG